MNIFFVAIAGELFIIIILMAFILFLLYLILEMRKPVPQTGVVKGNVVYGDSALVGGVLMTLTSSDGSTADSTLTGADGTFEFNPMAIGDYALTAHKDLPDGWLEYTGTVEINAPEIIITDLPLEKPGGAAVPMTLSIKRRGHFVQNVKV